MQDRMRGDMGAEEIAIGRRRGRRVLIAAAVAGLALTVGAEWLGRRLARDFCPNEVVAHGTGGGTRWETSRADCGAGRIVLQLRVIPPKGVSTLVYSAEGGPAPIAWNQSGRSGTLTLAEPIDGSDVLPVDLDPKGRPIAAIEVSHGRRIR
jgi:hypothetical protein